MLYESRAYVRQPKSGENAWEEGIVLRKAREMHHFVAVVDSDDELLEVPPRLGLLQPSIAHNQLKQVPPGRILHGDA